MPGSGLLDSHFDFMFTLQFLCEEEQLLTEVLIHLQKTGSH